MRLDLLSQLLEDAGLGVQGQTIFIHRMDAECNQGIMLRMPIAGVPSNPELPLYYKATFQAIIRAQAQAAGDLLAKQVADTLTIYNREFFDTSNNFLMQIKQMYPDRLPIVYPRSVGHDVEWSVNFHTDYVMT